MKKQLTVYRQCTAAELEGLTRAGWKMSKKHFAPEGGYLLFQRCSPPEKVQKDSEKDCCSSPPVGAGARRTSAP
jgi:hypothetical protein